METKKSFAVLSAVFFGLLLVFDVSAQNQAILSMSDDAEEFVDVSHHERIAEFTFVAEVKTRFTRNFALTTYADPQQVDIVLETNAGEYFVISRRQIQSSLEKVLVYFTTRTPAEALQSQHEGYEFDVIDLPFGQQADISYIKSDGICQKISLLLFDPEWNQLKHH